MLLFGGEQAFNPTPRAGGDARRNMIFTHASSYSVCQS